MDHPTEKGAVGADHSSVELLDDQAKKIILRELGKILVSRPFRNSGRSKEFLSYVVHNRLEGHAENLKERTIGNQLFQRQPDYPTGDDPVVRVHAGEVRRRLQQYYFTSDESVPVRIDIPVGSYSPEFSWNTNAPQDQFQALSESGVLERGIAGGEHDPESNAADDVPSVENQDMAPSAARLFAHGLRKYAVRILGSLAIVVLGTACLLMWIQLRTLNRKLNPWQYQPAVNALWSKFLGPAQVTDVVMEDETYLLLQIITNEKFTLQDYLNHGYLIRLQNPEFSKEKREILGQIASRSLARITDGQLQRDLLEQDPLDEHLHFYFASEYNADLAGKHNVILIGSRFSNPWAELFEKRAAFTAESGMPTLIRNRAPLAGEQQIYMPIDSPNQNVQYCAVAYLPNPNHNGRILLIQGTNGVATFGGLEFLLSEDQIANLRRRIHTTEFPYFELLLKTSNVSSTPFATTLEAVRTYPDLH
jgi:hypothetical protein